MVVARYMRGILTIPTYPFVFSKFAHSFFSTLDFIKESYNIVLTQHQVYDVRILQYLLWVFPLLD